MNWHQQDKIRGIVFGSLALVVVLAVFVITLPAWIIMGYGFARLKWEERENE